MWLFNPIHPAVSIQSILYHFRAFSSLTAPNKAYKRAGEGLVTRTYCGRAMDDDFILKESRFKLAIRK